VWSHLARLRDPRHRSAIAWIVVGAVPSDG
jgi:hypothetical protein